MGCHNHLFCSFSFSSPPMQWSTCQLPCKFRKLFCILSYWPTVIVPLKRLFHHFYWTYFCVKPQPCGQVDETTRQSWMISSPYFYLNVCLQIQSPKSALFENLYYVNGWAFCEFGLSASLTERQASGLPSFLQHEPSHSHQGYVVLAANEKEVDGFLNNLRRIHHHYPCWG